MKHVRNSIILQLVLLLWVSWAHAQQPSVNPTVPHLVKFSGSVKGLDGKPLISVAGVTFSLYKEDQGGAPLWLETQNVQLDASGRYSVMLGATKPDGLPADLFTSGEARWLGVQPEGQAEQPRVLLLSVPYALKAADASTLGGLPPSAFLLAPPPTTSAVSETSATPSINPPASAITGTGTVNYVPLWTSSSNIGNSMVFQSGTGSSAKLGLNLTAPAATLDVNGGVLVRGPLQLHSLGTATASSGFNSNPYLLTASSFSSSTGKAISQNFQWQAEPSGNNTSSPAGTLNLLFGANTTPTETGLKISNKGIVTFATGQTFPGAGTGTVTSVSLSAPSSDFTISGSPITASGTLGLNWSVAPTSTNTANAIVKRDGSGNFSTGQVTATYLNATGSILSSYLLVGSSAPVPVFVGSSAVGATTIFSEATSATGANRGVEGLVASSDPAAYGVFGNATATSGLTKGVYGLASSVSGVGVFGQDVSLSATGAAAEAGYEPGAGVWGDGGPANFGVVGTTDSLPAGYFENNTDASSTLYVQNDNSIGASFLAYNSATGGYCQIDYAGNLSCSGTKNAVVPLDGGKRKVAISAIESPKNWFEDFGSAQLTGGSAVVALDPDFTQTVNASVEYHVFLTPNGDCRGLYISRRTPTSFEVRELGGGSSTVEFSYRIVALRKNYENVRFADHTNDPDPRKLMERMRSGRPVQANSQTKPASTKNQALLPLPIGQGSVR